MGGAAPAPEQAGLPRITEHESLPQAFSRLDPSSPQTERKRWRYVLDWGKTSDDDVPMLVQRAPSSRPEPALGPPPPNHRSKPPTSSTSFFRSMSNFSALNLPTTSTQPPSPDDNLITDYTNLFRCMYNHAPHLDSMNIATAYTQSKSLLHLASLYRALPVVGPRIDHHLLRFQSRLFKQIAKYPSSYLKLGFLARSRVIFSEALIHVVGMWPAAEQQLRGVEEEVWEIVEDKVEELEEVKGRVEVRLARLGLATSRGERVGPGNGYLDWLVVCLFRQWVAEQMTPPPVGILKPGSSGNAEHRGGSGSSRGGGGGGAHAQPSQRPQQPHNTGRTFRLLGSSNPNAYLPHDDQKRFLKLTPDLYTRENLKRFERRMDELKNLARDAVRPLTRNCLEVDLGGFGEGGLGYLTCTRVGEEDFPWDD